MSWDVVLKQCAALRVSLASVEAQVVAIEAYAHTQQRGRARIERPATCDGYKAEDCARLCDEAAIEMGGMGGSARVLMCRGCGASVT